MQTDIALLSPDLTVEQAWRQFGAEASPRYLVGADRHLVGVVDFEDLDKALASGNGAKSVWSVVDHDFVHAHPDHGIDIVLDRLAQGGGILPVVSRTDVRQLEGVITLDGLLKRTDHPDGPPISSSTKSRSAIKDR